MNALLLALLAGATWQLTLGFATAAGLLIGIATALEGISRALILYLAGAALLDRGDCRDGIGVRPVGREPTAIYGVAASRISRKTFWRLGNSGWPIRGNNQSLIAALDRLTLGFVRLAVDPAGVRVAADAPLALALFAVLALVLVGAFVVRIVRTPRRPSFIPCEIAMATVLAILLSPIAWDHYWTMMLPAFLIVYDAAQDQRRWVARCATPSGPRRFSPRGFRR